MVVCEGSAPCYACPPTSRLHAIGPDSGTALALSAYALGRTRKKDGSYPFARLSLASTQCLIEDAVGRFAGYRKKDRGPVERVLPPVASGGPKASASAKIVTG